MLYLPNRSRTFVPNNIIEPTGPTPALMWYNVRPPIVNLPMSITSWIDVVPSAIVKFACVITTASPIPISSSAMSFGKDTTVAPVSISIVAGVLIPNVTLTVCPPMPSLVSGTTSPEDGGVESEAYAVVDCGITCCVSHARTTPSEPVQVYPGVELVSTDGGLYACCGASGCAPGGEAQFTGVLSLS